MHLNGWKVEKLTEAHSQCPSNNFWIPLHNQLTAIWYACMEWRENECYRYQADHSTFPRIYREKLNYYICIEAHRNRCNQAKICIHCTVQLRNSMSIIHNLLSEFRMYVYTLWLCTRTTGTQEWERKSWKEFMPIGKYPLCSLCRLLLITVDKFSAILHEIRLFNEDYCWFVGIVATTKNANALKFWLNY